MRRMTFLKSRSGEAWRSVVAWRGGRGNAFGFFFFVQNLEREWRGLEGEGLNVKIKRRYPSCLREGCRRSVTKECLDSDQGKQKEIYLDPISSPPPPLFFKAQVVWFGSLSFGVIEWLKLPELRLFCKTDIPRSESRAKKHKCMVRSAFGERAKVHKSGVWISNHFFLF